MTDKWHSTKTIEDKLKEIEVVSQKLMLLEHRVKSLEAYVEREENRKKDAINLLKIE